MEADRMVNSFIRQEDLSSEMTVVRNEMEMYENNPNIILEERMLSTAYLWHNYGKSTIGARADVEHVPATNLRRFYEKYYQPDNATLVVVGKFDATKTLAHQQDLRRRPAADAQDRAQLHGRAGPGWRAQRD